MSPAGLLTRDPTEAEGLAERLRAAIALLPPVLGGAPSQPLEVGRASRAVHEGGWRLARLLDGRLTAIPPAPQRPHRRHHAAA